MARCTRCHRQLTSAESIAAGIGPVCLVRMQPKPARVVKARKQRAARRAMPTVSRKSSADGQIDWINEEETSA